MRNCACYHTFVWNDEQQAGIPDNGLYSRKKWCLFIWHENRLYHCICHLYGRSGFNIFQVKEKKHHSHGWEINYKKTLHQEKDCDIISEIHCSEVLNCLKKLKTGQDEATEWNKYLKGREGDSGLWIRTGRLRHRLRALSRETWLWEHSGADRSKRLVQI